MGKKKSFINKKDATTYNLIYRNAELGQEDEPAGREWTETSRGVGVGRPDADAMQQQNAQQTGRWPPNHPLAWLEEEQDNITEDRRRELVEHGFPDDGYDYLKHLRVLGRGTAALDTSGPASNAEEAGPSVFVPASHTEKPEDDRRVFDARRLALHQAAQDNEDAAAGAGGVSAFSKPLPRLHKSNQQEVDELEQAMAQLAEAGSPGNTEEGQGDLLDDFVLSATQAEAGSQQQAAQSPQPAALQAGDAPRASDEAWGSDAEVSTDDEGSAEQLSSDEEEAGRGRRRSEAGPGSVSGSVSGSEAGSKGRRVGSIASTYWRPAREDRREALSVIDERFEQLALQYDSDEIGGLDEMEGTGEMEGTVSINQFQDMLDEFLDTHRTADHAHEAGFQYETAAASAGDQHRDPEAAAAVAKARELIRQEEALPEPEGEIEFIEVPDMRERWDCESVLSVSSNLYNHPGRIAEPRQRIAEGIRLSRKTGLPVAVPATPVQDSEASTVTGLSTQPAAAAASQPRQRGETAEQRRERKQGIKMAQRQARETKKSLKTMFKEESVKQKRQGAGMPSASVVNLG